MHLCRRPLGQAPQPIRNRSVPWRSLLAVAAGLALVATPLQPSAAAPVATPEVRQLSVPRVGPGVGKTVAAAGLRKAGRVLAELPARATDRFSTLGVTWAPGGKAAQVEVRVRSGRTWSDWMLLEDNSIDGPDGAEAAKARPGTAPLWVGNSNGVQVRLVAIGSEPVAAPADVKVALIDSTVSATDGSLQPQQLQPSGSETTTSVPKLYPAPAVVSRARWGADESLRSYNGDECATPRYDRTIRAAIVHHTAGANNYSSSQSAAQVRGIYAYHVKTRGWCDIGYNFLVDKYGTIFEGRYGGIWNVVHGAHARSWNTDTVGIAMMANFETAEPTSVTLNSVAKVLAWKLEGFYRNPTGRVTLAGKNIKVIARHGDVIMTACPGRNMTSRMDSLPSMVKSKVGSFNTPIYQRWQSLGGESGWVGSPSAPERPISDGRITRFAGADILWSSSTGAHWVAGSHRTKYRSLGDAKHYLGFPVREEAAGPLGSRMTGFESGAIYSSSATSAVDLYWSFYRRYQTLDGRTQGYLGLPTASQRPGFLPGSQYQPFQSGGLYWTSATGSHPIYRSFHAYYQRLGSTAARLGLPTAAQRAGGVPGSQVQTFEKGRLYWLSSLGTQEVNGQIFTTYASLGAELGRLGLPTRGDYAVPEGRATDFQGGRIVFNASTGRTTVTYY
jgi:uncharacterized protein with LGFP repeats